MSFIKRPFLELLLQLAVTTNFSLINVHHRYKPLPFAVYAICDLHLIVLVDLVQHYLTVLYVVLVQQLLRLGAVGAICGADDDCLLLVDDLVETFEVVGLTNVAPQFLHFNC